MERPRVLILGKLPPPYIGPAVATKIIMESHLNDQFKLFHFDTRINENVSDMGTFKFSKFSTIRDLYRAFRQKITHTKPALVLIPIGQTAAGFFKDISFIRMASASGARVVLQLRGSEFRGWYDGLDAIRKRVVKTHLRKADGVIVLGENLRWIFKDLFSENRIYVVPNGGDYTFPERKNHTLRITYLANYLPGKGLLELLEALILLNGKKLPSFEFHAFGSWNNPAYRQKCMEIAGRPNMAHCHIHGAVSGPEKWQALADSDVFVFAPKTPEGHPWSIVEAMAAGLPIVSTHRGAIAQSVVHGENGFLLDHPDPALLAEALSNFLKDENLRKSMAGASRQKYLKDFTASRMVENLGTVFHDLIHLPVS